MGENKSQLKLIVIVGLILASVLVGAVAVNESLSIPNESFLNKTEPKLAEFVNGKSINTLEVQDYIKWYNNFSSLHFEEIGNKTEISTAMQIGNFDHKLEGFTIDNKMYAIELVACDERTKGCSFKINGIDTGKIYSADIGNEPKIFSLNNNYDIKINSIIFNFCNHKRFCDTYFEAYDLVELKVIRK